MTYDKAHFCFSFLACSSFHALIHVANICQCQNHALASVDSVVRGKAQTFRQKSTSPYLLPVGSVEFSLLDVADRLAIHGILLLLE